jgi:hypothetical protein
MAMTD